MNKIPFIFAAALLCSCSSDWSAGLTNERGEPMGPASGVDAAQTQRVANGAVLAANAGFGKRGFASASDRGSLVQYASQNVARQTGAYTWHAARFSEEHALRATSTGQLNFDAPDGRRITLDYVRHIEHSDGNWTWIGRGQDGEGADAVITFGERAVFGTIPQGEEPELRLTMADGIGWVVSADPKQLAEIDNAATRPEAMDFLIPPKLGGAAEPGGMTAAGSTAVAASATGTITVDVLVGYTVGFASNLGGDSAALTRVHNLVDITNQAYVNSQINAKVRLVHSMSVNYADATKNGLALEELTGFKAPSTQTTPAAAFTALRQARETYGADLVVLLRRFQDPENDGCGVAWLIGGGRSGIEQRDGYFGYSVVSDGRDQGTDGKTYFCREETFAHELGHNMGSQHDLANAKKDNGDVSYGAFDYSFGHKTDSATGNFYTIMAYGDSGQARYRVFSNPGSTYCGGGACGVAGSADNARSMREAAPLVAGFRTTVVAEAPSSTQRGDDANADGRSDLFWHSSTQKSAQNWYMNGANFTYSITNAIGSDYRSAGVGDFNGDGRADIIWYDTARTSVWLWQARIDGTYDVIYLRAYPSGWEIEGIADFNGDARADLFWHNKSGQATQAWLMNGSTWTYGAVNGIPSKYDVAAVGDTNGDGRADVVWQDDARSQVWLWQARVDGAFDVAYLRSFPSGWHIDALGDSNGDGREDIFWHNNTQGLTQSWLMNGSTWVYGSTKAVGSQYQVAGSGDFNGDGLLDLVWRDSARTTLWQWQARAGGGYDVQYLRSYPSGWELLNY